MKKIMYRLASAGLGLALVLSLCASAPAAAPAVAAENSGDEPASLPAADMAVMPEPALYTMAGNTGTISVTGKGIVKVKPDIAYLSLGVFTENADAAKAQQENARRMTAVIEAVKELGVLEEDIQTSGYYMYPQYQYYSNKEAEITGYSVTNNVSIKVRDIDTTGKVLDAAAEAGANQNSGISFGCADSSDAYLQALSAALEDARRKGDALAAPLGVTLGLPLEITEQSSYYAPSTYYNAMPEMAAYDAGYETPVKAGELEISASVSVKFGY